MFFEKKLFSKMSRMLLCILLLMTATIMLGFINVYNVVVNADGNRIELRTVSNSPEDIIERAGVMLKKGDVFELSTEKIEDNTEITVYRACSVIIEHYDGRVERVYTVKKNVGDFLADIGYGDEKKYASSVSKDAKITKDIYVSIQDQASLERFGYDTRRYVMTPEGILRYKERRVMEATAYLPTDGDGQCITATGLIATYGIVAVDPDVIPLWTRLYIPGYGVALAADTGGVIIGNIVDLCMEDYDECIEFGRRDVEVYILAD